MQLNRTFYADLARQQTVFLSVAAVIAAVFWAIGLPVNPMTIIVYSLLFGNSVTPVMAYLGRYYWNKRFPWNWLLFLLCVLAVMVPAYVLASFVVRWVAPPTPGQTTWHLVRTGWKLPVLVVVVYSAVGFVYRTMKDKLEQRNKDLQRSVERGSAELRVRKQELERAREIQESLLPKHIPQVPGFEIAAAWRPAFEVSGDYFDVFRLGASKLGFCIADVVGKGVSAALLMANVQAAVRAFASEHESTSAICGKVNRLLCENIVPGKFVTFLLGVVDCEQRTLCWCNAGHLEPILISSGVARTLDGAGAALGVFSDWDYREEQITMRPGDRLLLFTDGITESGDCGVNEFGEQRIARCAEAHCDDSAAQLNAHVLGEVDSFCAARFQDDATLLVVAALG